MRKPYWLIFNLKKRYLVYEPDKSFGKPWNTRMYWVKDKRRATRYTNEISADTAIYLYNSYTHAKNLLVKEEIWE